MRSRGFTLLELSIVLIIIALVTGMAVTSGISVVASARQAATQNKMRAIDDALMKYRAANDRLPCPADLTLAPGSANYGLEAGAGSGSSIATATGVCTGTGMLPQANFTGAGATNTWQTAAEGALPAITLGLPPDFMYDGWGNRFRYAVDISYTAGGAFVSNGGVSCLNGAITVNDGNANARSTNALYALISHGANGHGAYTKNGVTYNSGSSSANELTNCHCTSAGVYNGSYAPVYVQKSPAYDSGQTGNASYYFDDLVSYRERWQMQTPWDKTASCAYVYVADAGNQRIEAFTLSGVFVMAIGSGYGSASSYAVGASGSANGQFTLDPVNGNGLVVDSHGYIWVSEGASGGSANYRMQEFTPNGLWVRTVMAGVTEPFALAVDSSNNIWMQGSAAGNSQIWELSNTGVVLNTFSSSGSAVGQTSMYSQNIAFDKFGYLWLADAGNNRIQKCSPTWSCTAYGTLGNGNAQFQQPWGITVDSSNNIWVFDEYHNLPIQEFSNNFDFLGIYGYWWGNSGCTVMGGTKHISMDANNNIWATDPGDNRVWEMSVVNGVQTCLGEINCSGSGPMTGTTTCAGGSAKGQFNSPQDIFVSSR